MKVIFLILLLLFSSQISYSQSYEYRQPLITENESSFNFNNEKRYKDSFFKNSLPEFNFLDSQYKKKLINEKEDKSSKSSKKPSNIKLLGGDQLITIHYVHNSGLGIAYNYFNPAIEYGIGTKPIYLLPFQDIFTISYNLNYDKLSFDFGLGAFSGGGEVHGCANYHTCYGDDPDIEINDGKLIQLFSSYEILKYLDITLGINWIMLTIEDKKHPYSDYRLDPREESIISPSLGFSIVFWF